MVCAVDYHQDLKKILESPLRDDFGRMICVEFRFFGE